MCCKVKAEMPLLQSLTHKYGMNGRTWSSLCVKCIYNSIGLLHWECNSYFILVNLLLGIDKSCTLMKPLKAACLIHLTKAHSFSHVAVQNPGRRLTSILIQ